MNKFIWLSVAGVLMVYPAMAQQPSTTSPAGPLLSVNELVLKVTPAKAEIIWKGLRKLPVEEVEQLMAELRQQVMEQQNKTVDKKE